jgi:hypothetical protein
LHRVGTHSPSLNCTAPSLMPTIIGNTFAASLHTDICPQRKEASTSHARNPFNLIFFIRLCGLMVRRWRLIWLFPFPITPSRTSLIFAVFPFPQGGGPARVAARVLCVSARQPALRGVRGRAKARVHLHPRARLDSRSNSN